MRRPNIKTIFQLGAGIGMLCLGVSVQSARTDCSFPNGDNTSVSEMVSAIQRDRAECVLPWRALKRVAANADARKRLLDAYTDILSKYPDRAFLARARAGELEAATGDPSQMLGIADANVEAHPEDKTLATISCWDRAAHGIDIQNAMPYCNMAVDNGRPGYALVNRAMLELQLKQFREALRDFEEALGKKNTLSPSALASATFGRGIARLRLGDKGGQDDVQLAIKTRLSVVDDFADFGVAP